MFSLLLSRYSRVQISVTTFTVLIALYQATVLNVVYYRQILLLLPLDSLQNWVFFISMPIVVFCVILGLLNLLYIRWLIKLIAIIFVIIGAPLTYFMLKFGIVIDRAMFRNVLETNQAESLALVTPQLIGYLILLGLLPACLIIWLKLTPVKSHCKYFAIRLINIMIAVVGILSIAALFYQHYAAFMRTNHNIIKYLTPSNYIAAIYGEYQVWRDSNLPFLILADDAKRIAFSDSKSDDKKMVLVFVVGETARSQNFSLNGYGKNTNPRLSQRDDVISFQNVSSCGTYTAHSLPCMFSNMTRENYDERIAKRQENVLDILHKTGVDVNWFDNDSGCKGVCDRVYYQDSTATYSKQNRKECTDGVCYDEVLLNDLHNKLENITDDTLIVLHTIGSHGPTYYQRYPKKFAIFSPTCDTNEINTCSSESLVNTYDNTVAYTDYIIDRAIVELTALQEKYHVGLIYLSDHGEYLGENGLYLHSLPYSMATKELTEVPMIMWFAKSYQQQLQIEPNCLSQLANNNAYSQDNLFHSLLGLFKITTKEYDERLDIFHHCQTGL